MKFACGLSAWARFAHAKPLFLGLIAGLSIAAAGPIGAQEVIPDFYNEPGISLNRGDINQHANEHIDPFSGTLQWHYSDINLPGNGGFNLQVTRSYNSALTSPDNPYSADTTMGLGWTMHFGRVMKTKDAFICQNTIGYSVAENPILELPDGSRQVLAFTGGTSPLALTQQFWRADCAPTGKTGLIIYAPDGTRYDMTAQYNIGTAPHAVNAWYTTKITDRNGNYATINYSTENALIPEISSVITSDGRRITFTYADSGRLRHRITQISAEGQIYKYNYTAVSGADYAYNLTEVERPDGTRWTHSYNGYLAGGAGSYLLSSMTYPQGGKISYAYDFVYFDAQANPTYRSTVVSKKTTSDGGTWKFSYTPGTLSSLDTTVVDAPDGKTTYQHIGPNYAQSGKMWMVGLLMSKSIGSDQSETYAWTNEPISSENYLRPGQFVTKVDAGETNAPVLAKKVIVRDGATYSTTYSNFDSYGNPRQVSESGPNGGSRTTTLSYFAGGSNWIIHLPKDESFSGGSVKRQFDTNGNLLEVTQDGVSTSYSYDSDGNVASMTNPRGYKTTYGSYYRGIPRSESQPENVSISRSVSDAGNVLSETDGENRTHSFSYDGLNRLTSISYPQGKGVSISYGAASKTARRGDLVESVSYDGFGRPSSITLGGIIRTYSFNSLGRLTFLTDPGVTSVAGTHYAYDQLGRVVAVTHAVDGTKQTISYGAGWRQTTDERGKSTTETFRAYGDPDKTFVIGLTAPVAAASVVIGRNARDLVTSVKQGSFTRSYGYNSNYYLTSITHPETGNTTYGRDAAGNMTSRAVGTSGITHFAYDGQNRLTTITYPGATPAVTRSYSKTHKLKSVKSSVAERTFAYDGNDNLVSDTVVTDGLALATGYAYNANDQLMAVGYPYSGNVIQYGPDVLGRPTQVSGYVSSVTYWPSGQVKQLIYANGTGSVYNQDNRLRPSLFATAKGSTFYNNASYAYDSTGNLLSIADSTDATFNRFFNYDALNRLTTAAGTWGAGEIAYDGTGNITTQKYGDYPLNHAYDASNRLTSISGSRNMSYAYDVYGNVSRTSGDVSTDYTWDDAPNLRCVNCTDPQNKIEYAYDGLNQRVSVTKQGIKTYEIYGQHGNLLAEYTPSQGNKLVEYIYLGDKRVAEHVKDDFTGPPTLTVTRTPTPMIAGQAYTLTLKNTNTATVRFVCTSSGSGFAGSGSVVPNYSSTGTASTAWIGYPSTCTWTATGPYGTQSVTETLTTIAPPLPTLTVTRNPSPMASGKLYTLIWASTHADSVSFNCTASGTGYKGSGTLEANGRAEGTADAGWVGYPSTCSWTATGPGGKKTVSETASTIVYPPPTLTVTRTPAPLTAGKAYSVTWATTNAGSVSVNCTASGTGYSGSSTLEAKGSAGGTASTAWVGYPSTCTWTATGPGGTKTVSETMTTVAETVPAPTLTVTRSPSPMKAGETYSVTWATTRAGSVSVNCTASGTGYRLSTTTLEANGSSSGTASTAWVGYPSACTWTATGPGGTKTVSETMTTVHPAPTLTVTRTPSPMKAGKTYSVTWATTNAGSVSVNCTASGTGYKGSGTLGANGSSSGTASTAWVGYPSTCSWTATGPGGTKGVTENMATVN